MRRHHSLPLIEPLESRIAPAALLLGYDKSLANPLHYTDTLTKNGVTLQFFNAADSSLQGVNLAIARTVGENPNVYFIKLTAGEGVEIPTSVGFQQMVNVTQGTVVAFFTNNGDGVVGYNDLTGVALGNKVSAGIGAEVHGDVVTDYNDVTGRLGGTSEASNSATTLLPNTITNLSVSGPIDGALIAGGAISKLTVTGSVTDLLTGTAANGYTISFETAQNNQGVYTTIPNSTGDMTLAVGTPAAGLAGPSISNVIIGGSTVAGTQNVGLNIINNPQNYGIHLGAGGAGAAGGSVNGLTILNDTDGFTVQAGAGGNGGIGKTFGGAGGSISNVVMNGPLNGPLTTSPDLTANSQITFLAGAGGAGVVTAKGGAGGAVQNMYIGYTAAGVANASVTTMLDNVTVQGGAGGTGGTAGAGGGLHNVNINTSTPGGNQLVLGNNIITAGGPYEVDDGTGAAIVNGNSSAGGNLLNGGATFGQGLANGNYTVVDDTKMIAGIFPDSTTITAVNSTGTQLILGSNILSANDRYEVDNALNIPVFQGIATSAGVAGVISSSNAAFGLGLVGLTIKDDITHASNVVTGLANAPTQFQLIGGAGGASTVGGKPGIGGSITNSQVLDQALPTIDANTGHPDDTGANSPTAAFALIQGGAGGKVLFKGSGAAGGGVSNLTLKGYNFTVASGAGGDGVAAGGAGGNISTVNVLGSAGALPGDNYHAQSVVIATGGGGNGSAGKGGAGGAIAGVDVENADFGMTGLSATGVLNGASGFQLTTGAGGTAGKGAAGAGGAITNVKATEVDFLTDSHTLGNSGAVNIATGAGGTAPVLKGIGGAGGALNNITIVGNRLTAPSISTGNGGNGGLPGGAGTGGAGGTITSLSIRSVEDLNPPPLSETLPAMDNTGGYTLVDNTANFVTEGIVAGQVVEDYTTTSANNGIPVVAIVTGVSTNELTLSTDIATAGDRYYFPNFGTFQVTAGAGGTGQLTGSGGAGGSINNSSIIVPGSVNFTAGSGAVGGMMGKAAAGAGGSLNGDTIGSSTGSGTLQAGSAGVVGLKAGVLPGLKPGAGGSIIGANVQALDAVSVLGGNGVSGGAGGSINGGGFSGVLTNGAGFNPPLGAITIEGGVGGFSGTGGGGAGGSISNLTGFVSLGDQLDATTTQFDGGAGGSGTVSGGAGGSVNNVRFYGGGGYDVTFFINAGDAGNASTGKTGAAGGSVTNISGGAKVSGTQDPNFSINTLTDFHHISAGNGGNSLGKGGVGGSVGNVYVNAAIGVRDGVAFGFDLGGAGGISAGAGGGAPTPGAAGNVTNVAADAIASIVAGHLGATGVATGSGGVFAGDVLVKANLATKVDGIYVNGFDTPSLPQQFDLTFNGQTSVLVPTNATPNQVASVLNELQSIIAAGGVTVVSGTNGYVITFNNTGTQAGGFITAQEPAPFYTTEVAMGTATTPEVQSVQVFGLNQFSLTFNGATTAPLAANASALTVAQDLAAIGAPVSPNGVEFNPGTSTTNPSYTITFNTDGAQSLIVPNFVIAVAGTQGTNTTPETDTLTFPTRGDFVPSQLATANFVGSIANPLRPNAATFSYNALVAGPSFAFGDSPIDGLIAAVSLTGNKNFIPEAFVTANAGGAAVLVDNLNS